MNDQLLPSDQNNVVPVAAHQADVQRDNQEDENEEVEVIVYEQSTGQSTCEGSQVVPLVFPPRLQDQDQQSTVNQRQEQGPSLLYNRNPPREPREQQGQAEDENNDQEEEPHMRYYRQIKAIAAAVGFRPPPGPPTREWFQQYMERRRLQAQQQQQQQVQLHQAQQQQAREQRVQQHQPVTVTADFRQRLTVVASRQSQHLEEQALQQHAHIQGPVYLPPAAVVTHVHDPNHAINPVAICATDTIADLQQQQPQQIRGQKQISVRRRQERQEGRVSTRSKRSRTVKHTRYA